MAERQTIKEYLIKLGFNVDKTSEQRTQQAIDGTKKSLEGLKTISTVLKTVIASQVVKTVVSFTKSLYEQEEAVAETAKAMRKSTEDARAYNTVLAAMGKTADEIKKSKSLTKTYSEMEALAKSMALPEAKTGVGILKEMSNSFLKLKIIGSYALQWLYHSMQEVALGPLQRFKNLIDELGETLKKNLPNWSGGFAKVVEVILRLASAFARGVVDVIKILDRVPGPIKAIGLALAALWAIMKAGPMGKAALVISGILLLLDDFYTYLEGGESLFGDFWGGLLNWVHMVEPVVSAFMDGLSTAIEWLSQGISWVLDQIGPDGVAILAGFTAAIVALNAALNGNPIGLIITAIMGLITSIGWLVENWDMLAQKTTEVWNIITEFVGGAVETIRQAAIDTVNGFVETVGSIVNAIGEALMSFDQWFYDHIVAPFEGLPDALGAAIGDIGGWFTTNVWNPITQVFSDVGGFFTGVASDIWDGFTGGLSSRVEEVKGTVTGFFSNIWDGVLNFFGIHSPSTLASDASGNVMEGFSQGAEDKQASAGERLRSVFSGIWDAAKSVWDSVTGWLGNLFGWTSEDESAKNEAASNAEAAAGEVSGAVQEAFSGVEASIADPITSGVSTSTEALTELQTASETTVGNIQTAFTGLDLFIAGIFKAAQEQSVEAYNPTVMQMDSIKLLIKSKFSSLASDFQKVFQQAAKSTKSAYSPIAPWFAQQVAKIKASLNSIPRKITVSVSATGAYSEGGVIDREMTARIGEGNRREYVIPVTKPARAIPLMKAAMKDLGMDVDSANYANQMLGGSPTSNKAPSYTHGSSGASTFKVDAHSTFNVYGSDAQSTANAIEHKQNQHVRNLKGVFVSV